MNKENIRSKVVQWPSEGTYLKNYLKGKKFLFETLLTKEDSGV